MYKLAIAIIGVFALVSAPAFAGKSKQWTRGCEDAKRGYFDQDNHPQAYKDGNRACENAAAPAQAPTQAQAKAGDFIPGSYAEVKSKGALYAGPDMGETFNAEVGAGRLVKINKCEPNDGLWCHVEAHSDSKVKGWIKAQNLRAK